MNPLGQSDTAGKVIAHPAMACNLDCERGVLGAILTAGSLDVDAGHRLLDKVVATGLLPIDFYLASHGELYRLLVQERGAGRPLDPVSIADAIEREGGDPHQRGRLAALAFEVTAVTPAPHWAAIVGRHARLRRAAAPSAGGSRVA
jgi:replicative DNA helicase